MTTTPGVRIDLSDEEAHPNTIRMVANNGTCIHMNAAETRAVVAALERVLKTALERWTECPHGNLIQSEEDGPCGCRVGAYTVVE